MKSLYLSNLHYFCAQTDGTYKFPNSAEGDLLKQAKKEIEALEAENARLQMELDASRETEDFRDEQNRQLRNELFGIKRRILETVTNDKMSDKAKVLDIQFVLRKEPQP